MSYLQSNISHQHRISLDINYKPVNKIFSLTTIPKCKLGLKIHILIGTCNVRLMKSINDLGMDPSLTSGSPFLSSSAPTGLILIYLSLHHHFSQTPEL